MSDRRNATLERFFTALISGQRDAARDVVSDVIDAGCDAQTVMMNLFWPTLQQLSQMNRNDQLGRLSYQYATRILRALADQMQLRLERTGERDQVVLVVCGAEDGEELAAQMTADLLEADGYRVYFGGGGIANDEIVDQLGSLKADKLVIFGAMPETVPATRQLIDHLHGIGVCPNLQITVGGGVFNRADGLAEEIGADLWASDPSEIVNIMNVAPAQRMSLDQRTVGRRRKAA